MAVDINKTFGVNNKPVAGKADRPKAQFWLNLGYDSGVKDEVTGNNKFISLPLGIPLDGQEALPTNSRNAEYANFNAARNDLYEQIMAIAEGMSPGEEQFINLQIQLRRVSEEHVSAGTTNNPFVQKIKLVG